MQVVLHFGAPYTDENRLQMCLGKNRDVLAHQGILIPRPSQFRKTLRPVLTRAQDAVDLAGLRDEFLQDITQGREAERIVFSTDTFLGIPRLAIADNQFFPGPFRRIYSFLRLFEESEVELFYAIRNPATFLQCLLKDYPDLGADSLLGHSDPYSLRWSEFFARILQECPGVNLTVWCNEDSPIIWDHIIRSISGVDEAFQLEGTYDLLKEIMTEEGFARFNEYLAKRPQLNAQQKQRVVSAFLDKFADETALEEEVDMPGFTEDVLETLTESYDDDVERILALPGIRFVEP